MLNRIRGDRRAHKQGKVNAALTLINKVILQLTFYAQANMPGPRCSLLLLTFAVLSAPGQAFAQASSASNATSTARLIRPLSILKISDLDFGGITSTAAGTVVINPDTNAVTYTGGVIAAGGSPRPASFMGSAVKRTVVNIRVPKQPILLRRTGGTETLTVSSWTLQGQSKRELAAQTTFSFAVGATVTIPTNPVEGDYTGTFDVEIQYP